MDNRVIIIIGHTFSGSPHFWQKLIADVREISPLYFELSVEEKLEAVNSFLSEYHAKFIYIQKQRPAKLVFETQKDAVEFLLRYS